MKKRKNLLSEYYNKINSFDIFNSQLPEFPYIADIELTNICNLKCIMCDQRYMQREKGFMSEELFRKIADECIENNVALRLIGLGEPFLHIIRYRTYDIGVKSKICCQLNSAYLSLKEIKGRIQDFAINRDGLRVPVAPGLFDYHIDWSGVKQFQIVQKQKGILQLKISLNEKSENEFNKISTRLLNDLYIVFGEQFIFNISYCDRIENTSRGKFRYFIQEMK